MKLFNYLAKNYNSRRNCIKTYKSSKYYLLKTKK